MIKFEVGTVYYSLSIVSDHVFAYSVIKRTAKTVTIKCLATNELITRRIEPSYRDEYEMVYPDGKYSMASSLGAKDTKEPRQVRDIPNETPFNQDKFFNGVYLDPAVEF
jgi:hypothetical protein